MLQMVFFLCSPIIFLLELCKFSSEYLSSKKEIPIKTWCFQKTREIAASWPCLFFSWKPVKIPSETHCGGAGYHVQFLIPFPEALRPSCGTAKPTWNHLRIPLPSCPTSLTDCVHVQYTGSPKTRIFLFLPHPSWT